MNPIKQHTDKLRISGLRPTKQRLAICKILFDRKETFHFTIDTLKKIIEKSNCQKISTATLYNTVHAFEKKGYLKQISLKRNKAYFDTNTKKHHHFYDEDSSQLTDIKNENIYVKNLPQTPSGKKIKEIDITIRIANNNQKQKSN